MAFYLGIDTSNYTTSAALYDSAAGRMSQQKLPLPVREGERGLRQSETVFHHTKRLPEVLERLLAEAPGADIAAVGVSVKPRDADGSYMPCFLSGHGAARQLAAALHIPLREASHQTGHILAALYGADALPLLGSPFIAFHVSGGTTEALLVSPAESGLFTVTLVGASLDLKAGQAVDRVGVSLGLRFPCGPALEALALAWDRPEAARPSLSGTDCSLSGVENRCRALLEAGAPKERIARVCLEHIGAALDGMTERILEKYGVLPVVYAGGVMSNSLLRKQLSARDGVYFAPPVFSADNAAGAALFAYLSDSTAKEDKAWPTS